MLRLAAYLLLLWQEYDSSCWAYDDDVCYVPHIPHTSIPQRRNLVAGAPRPGEARSQPRVIRNRLQSAHDPTM